MLLSSTYLRYNYLLHGHVTQMKKSDWFKSCDLIKMRGRKKTEEKTVRSGIRTHAYNSRLRPERSALDRSAILTCDDITTEYQLSKEKLYKQNSGPTWTI